MVAAEPLDLRPEALGRDAEAVGVDAGGDAVVEQDDAAGAGRGAARPGRGGGRRLREAPGPHGVDQGEGRVGRRELGRRELIGGEAIERGGAGEDVAVGLEGIAVGPEGGPEQLVEAGLGEAVPVALGAGLGVEAVEARHGREEDAAGCQGPAEVGEGGRRVRDEVEGLGEDDAGVGPAREVGGPGEAGHDRGLGVVGVDVEHVDGLDPVVPEGAGVSPGP